MSSEIKLKSFNSYQKNGGKKLCPDQRSTQLNGKVLSSQSTGVPDHSLTKH